ncbi:MAG: PRC-barrel domain-containing protein [Clostridia bacterium]|nr:PRC-barrel domain-containing protein [Clostridia bacterium]
MQISSLIGKQLLSPAGEKLGFVLRVYLSRDFKKVSCLLCADEEDEEFILPARAVLSFGDAVIAGKARLLVPAGITAPVYTHTGERVGTLTDLIVENGETEPLFVSMQQGVRTEYPLSHVLPGDTVLVFPTPAEKKKASARRTGATKSTKPKQTQLPPVQTEPPTRPAEKRNF